MIGPWFKARREELELRQSEVARAAKISAAYLSDIEANRRTPALDVTLRLGGILGLPLDISEMNSGRGMRYLVFKDRDRQGCVLQDSSLASKLAFRLGSSDGDSFCMHLGAEQAWLLAMLLLRAVEDEKVPSVKPDKAAATA